LWSLLEIFLELLLVFIKLEHLIVITQSKPQQALMFKLFRYFILQMMEIIFHLLFIMFQFHLLLFIFKYFLHFQVLFLFSFLYYLYFQDLFQPYFKAYFQFYILLFSFARLLIVFLYFIKSSIQVIQQLTPQQENFPLSELSSISKLLPYTSIFR